MAGAQTTIISKGMRHRKQRINPLESVSPVEFCGICQDEVAVEIDEGRWQVIWVYRKRCLRCGSVIQWGAAKAAFDRTDPETVQAVTSWILATGKDRR
jgi:hypothetical protein